MPIGKLPAAPEEIEEAGGSWPSPRCRRSTALVAYWDKGRFVLENYLTGKVSAIPVPLAVLIDRLNELTPVSRFMAMLPDVSYANEILSLLIEQNIIVLEGSELFERELRIEQNWKWGLDARYFHFATNNTTFECNDEKVWKELEARALGSPPPPPFKEYCGEMLSLPRPRSLDISLGDALLSRRTCRSFTGASIDLRQLSDLLWWTWGRTNLVQGQSLGDIVLKTSPSGGARHPVEVYCLTPNVDGVEKGIYHYSVEHHGLSLLKHSECAHLGAELCSYQMWVRDAAVVFIMTAVIERTMWKYHQSHAYRVIQLDAGHLGQTFHLVCSALGLGPFTTAATANGKIEANLSLDGVSEIVVYTAAAGHKSIDTTSTA